MTVPGTGSQTPDAERSVPAGARLLAAILLLLLMTLLFFPGAFSGGAFYYRDMFRVHHPAKTIGLASLADVGQLPWWSDNHSLGQPFLADPNYTVFYPSNLLYLVLPFNAAFNFQVVLHVFLCALFTLLLARALCFSWPASLVAAAALAFSGFTLSLGNFYNAVASACYLPLVLCLFLAGCAVGPVQGRVIARRQTAGLAAGAGLALALQFLGGEPVYLFLTAGVLLLAAGAGLVLRRLSPGRVALFLCLAALLAALAAAVQLLPSAELLHLTDRGSGFTLAEAARHSVHPFRLLELACPGLFGDPHALSFWGFWGHGWFDGNFPYILTIYCGAGLLLLALAAPLGRRPRLALVLWAGLLLFVLLAMGRHTPVFPALFKLLPGSSMIRYPVKFLFPALFCLALLAGMGADLAWHGAGRKGGRRQRVLAILLVGTALVCGILLLALAFNRLPGFQPLLAARGLPAEPMKIAARGMEFSVAHGLALGLASALLLALCCRLRGVWHRAAAGSLFLLLAVDLLITLGGLNPVAPPDFFTAPPVLLAAIEARESGPGASGGEFRLYHDSGKDIPSVQLQAPENDRIWHFHWMRQTLFPMTADLDYAFEPNWDGLYLEPGVQAARVARTLPAAERARFLGLFNVRYLVQFRETDDPLLEVLARWSGGSNLEARLLVNRACLPRAYWVPRALRRPTEPDMVRALVSPSFDPQREVVLPGTTVEASAENEKEPIPGLGDAPCRLLRHGAGEVEVELTSPAPGYLVLADSFAPGWRAMLDGTPALIEQANLAVRAVKVPRGRHTVTFSYRPRWRVAGPAISLAGILLALVLLLAAALPPGRGRERGGS
jgi:hypothetical protein